MADPERAGILAGFFKTGPGDYGEGDVFLGVSVPAVRAVAKKHTGMPLAGIRKLLNSRLHEVRLAALLVLVEKYRLAGAAGKLRSMSRIRKIGGAARKNTARKKK